METKATRKAVAALIVMWVLIIILYLVILIQSGASPAKMVTVVGFVPVGAFSIVLYLAAKQRNKA